LHYPNNVLEKKCDKKAGRFLLDRFSFVVSRWALLGGFAVLNCLIGDLKGLRGLNGFLK